MVISFVSYNSQVRMVCVRASSRKHRPKFSVRLGGLCKLEQFTLGVAIK